MGHPGLADILNALPRLRYLWAAGSVVGVAAGAYTFAASARDERWVLSHSVNHAKRIIATQAMREQAGMLFVQLVFAFVRLWTLTWDIPGRLTDADVRPWVAVLLRNWGVDATVLTMAQVLLALLAYFGYRARRRATAALAAQYPATPDSRP